MITNEDIHFNGSRIFGVGPGHESKSEFSDRRDSAKGLESEIKKSLNHRKIIIISDIWGAGKSFLMKMALLKMGIGETVIRIPPVLFLKKEDLISQAFMNFCVVDDIDAKKSYKKITEKLPIIKNFIEEHEIPIVLIGDYLLQNKNIRSSISNEQLFTEIKLERLDKKIFIEETIQQRINHYLRGGENPNFFDNEFLDYLLPNTDPPVANYRDVFNICASLIQYLDIDRNECEISGKIFNRKWVRKEKYREPDIEIDIFLQWLHDYIIRFDLTKEIFYPLETAQICKERPIEGITSGMEYEKKILIPLTEKGLLKSVGIPYLNSQDYTEGRLPGPYLPSVETFLDAKYGYRFGDKSGH